MQHQRYVLHILKQDFGRGGKGSNMQSDRTNSGAEVTVNLHEQVPAKMFRAKLNVRENPDVVVLNNVVTINYCISQIKHARSTQWLPPCNQGCMYCKLHVAAHSELDLQVHVSESSMTKRLDMIEHRMQLISAQIGHADVTFTSKQPHAKALIDASDQAGAAQPGNGTSASLTQQLRDMRVELSHLQQAQLSIHTQTASVASTKLAGLQGHLEEQSSQVQKLHQAVAECKQGITVLQNSTEAQGKAAAERQRGHQDLVLQMGNVSTDLEHHGSDLRDAVSHLEEHRAVEHAQLSEQLSQNHTDFEKLSSSSKLHDEQLMQHSAMLAQHKQQLLSSESLGAEMQLALHSLQERLGSAATSAPVTGMLWDVHTSWPSQFPVLQR